MTFGTAYYNNAGLTVTANGTSGQVLTSNGASAPTYQTPSTTSLPIVFSAHYSGDVSNVTGDGTVYTLVPATTDIITTGFSYNSGTGAVTIPTTGIYLLLANFQISGITSSHTLCQYIINSSAGGGGGTQIGTLQPYSPFAVADSNGSCTLLLNTVISLSSANTYKIQLAVYNGTKVIGLANTASAVNTFTYIRIG